MKVLNVMCAVLAMILFAGCGNNVLDYVPPQAGIVQYGNVDAFFKSKIWNILKNNKYFQNDVLSHLRQSIPFNDLADFSGKFVVWGEITKSSDKIFGGVIMFEKDIAEDIFNRMLKFSQQEGKTKVGEINGCKAFESFSSRGKVEAAIVLVDDDEIHVIVNGKARIWEAVEKDNAIAEAINPDSMIAIATNGPAWKNDWDQKEVGFDISQIGIAKVEAYLTQNEIKINANVDISKIK